MNSTKEILLDPVYTGKAFAGMLDLIEKGDGDQTSQYPSCIQGCRRCSRFEAFYDGDAKM